MTDAARKKLLSAGERRWVLAAVRFLTGRRATELARLSDAELLDVGLLVPDGVVRGVEVFLTDLARGAENAAADNRNERDNGIIRDRRGRQRSGNRRRQHSRRRGLSTGTRKKGDENKTTEVLGKDAERFALRALRALAPPPALSAAPSPASAPLSSPPPARKAV